MLNMHLVVAGTHDMIHMKREWREGCFRAVQTWEGETPWRTDLWQEVESSGVDAETDSGLGRCV